ncbi:MAG TPA: hypothetical protein VJB57_02300 [Dehalococcoidia bacterium]|nr:hypothetical protein [Dehalococcoidia bacterium]
MLLFTSNDHHRVASGEITVSFRLWKYAHVKAAKTYPATFGGRLQIDNVQLLPAALVSHEDALLAGHTTVAGVWEMAGSHTRTVVTPDTLLYRVQFTYLPENDSQPGPSEKALADLDAIVKRLQRMDALSQHGAWTETTLRLIAMQPGLRAKDLMAMAERYDLASFKADVRKLKGLGLTISLGTGYELSEAGRKLLKRL